jgi:hypothetical protein
VKVTRGSEESRRRARRPVRRDRMGIDSRTLRRRTWAARDGVRHICDG